MQRHSIERKQRLQEKFIAALDLLDEQQREPDRWEEECLSYALSALACGLYLVAEVELEAFSRPVAERLPETVAALNATPRRFSKAMLRRALERVVDCENLLAVEQQPTADQIEALGRARLFVVEQEIGDEGVGLALPAEGRGLAVARHELNIVSQRP
jgi:hypothetical protein